MREETNSVPLWHPAGRRSRDVSAGHKLADDLAQTYHGSGFKGPFEPLTTREREVLRLIAEVKSNKAVANLLFISVRTVQNHRANIMKKLKIRKTADLVKYAIRKGYVSVTT
jgi:DNA-binding NarL/FixJ family response regulator